SGMAITARRQDEGNDRGLEVHKIIALTNAAFGGKGTSLRHASISAFDPKRTSVPCFRHTPLITILPYHRLLVSLVDSEGRLQARLTARSQRVLPLGRHQRMTRAPRSVAVSKALEALAGRT